MRVGPPSDLWVCEAGSPIGPLRRHDSDRSVDRQGALDNGRIPWRARFEAFGTLKRHPRLTLEIRLKGNVHQGGQWRQERGLIR